MTTPHLHDTAVRFIAYLQQYKADRGALANLRGALSDARRQRAWPLLGTWLSKVHECDLRTFEIAAALWAGDPAIDSPTAGNLGDTLRHLTSENTSFEGRFKRLLTCDRDEIAARVAPIVRAAQAKGIRVNYTRLLSDLLWWNERTKEDWARAFWGAPETDVALDADPSTPSEAPVPAVAEGKP